MKVTMNVLDEKIETIQRDVVEIKKHTRATNGRVTSLERWQAKIIGAIVGASAFAGGAWVVFEFYIDHNV